MSIDRIIALKTLENQFRNVKKEPTGYFKFELKEEDLFEWIIYMHGTVDTPYEGGVFKLCLKWTEKAPYEPPSLYVLSDFWHPNVYEDGKVCISILHPPGEDPLSGERPEERWLPVHTAETIMLSFMSMLCDPNTQSPANIDSSVQFRDYREEYNEKVKKLAIKSQEENKNVEIPKMKKRFEPFMDEGIGNIDENEEEDGETMVLVIGEDESEEEDGEAVFSPGDDGFFSSSPGDEDDGFSSSPGDDGFSSSPGGLESMKENEGEMEEGEDFLDGND